MKITGFDRVSIQQCCTNKLLTSNGFIWSYDELSAEQINNILKNKKWDLTPKIILQLDKEGNLVHKYISLGDVNRKTGFDQSYISNCCRGKCKNAYGYNWVYEDKKD